MDTECKFDIHGFFVCPLNKNVLPTGEPKRESYENVCFHDNDCLMGYSCRVQQRLNHSVKTCMKDGSRIMPPSRFT